MPLDQTYTALMLHYVARLWKEVGGGRRCPPPNPWIREAKYQDLLTRTVLLARSAQVVAEHMSVEPLSGRTHLSRWFLDGWKEEAAAAS